MKIAIIGSREFNNKEVFNKVLIKKNFAEDSYDLEIITGGAIGIE